MPTPLPQRKSPRAEFHDYSGGKYIVTICTRDKVQYFGKIILTKGKQRRCDEMVFSPIGEFCHEQLESLPTHYPYAEVPLFVVMPNHVHAIICIDGDRTHRPCVPTERSLLSIVVGGFKRAVTMFAKLNNLTFRWQPRYHDHVIRSDHDGNLIANYITNNVANWKKDRFYILTPLEYSPFTH